MLVKPDICAEDPVTVAFLHTLYDIDFALLKKNNKNNALVERLVKFGLDFNNGFDKDLQKACAGNLACENAYNVISSYKFYIKGFLGELNLYKHFSHFFIFHYITSTVRVFGLPYYLQLQGNKFAKAFIRYVKQSKLNAEDIKKIEEIIQQVIPYVHPSNYFSNKELSDTELENRFNTNTRGLFNKFLYNFVKEGKNTPVLTYPYDSGDVMAQLLWLSTYCKKQFELLYVRLILHAGLANDYEHLIVEKDATGSGTQIISMLIRNSTLAKQANVIYTPTPNDLYSDVTKLFEQRMDKQVICFEEFCITVLQESSEKFLRRGFDSTVGYQLKELFLTDDRIEFTERYFKLAPDLKRSNLDESILAFDFPVTNATPDSQMSGRVDPLFKALLRASEYCKHFVIMQAFPRALLNRKLFKLAVMALGYAQGEESRTHTFNEQLKEHFISQGFAKPPLTVAQQRNITSLLSFTFEVIAKELLKPVKAFLTLTRKYVDATENIQIPLKYLTWNFRIKETLQFRHRMHDGEAVRQFSLYHTFGISKKEMATTFPSIFVQGLDAHIVHECLNTLHNINVKLREHGIPEILLKVNHDCFGFNMQYAQYQTLIIQQAYNSINDLTLPVPGLLSSNSHPIMCTSPHVIKH